MCSPPQEETSSHMPCCVSSDTHKWCWTAICSPVDGRNWIGLQGWLRFSVCVYMHAHIHDSLRALLSHPWTSHLYTHITVRGNTHGSETRLRMEKAKQRPKHLYKMRKKGQKETGGGGMDQRWDITLLRQYLSNIITAKSALPMELFSVPAVIQIKEDILLLRKQWLLWQQHTVRV